MESDLEKGIPEDVASIGTSEKGDVSDERTNSDFKSIDERSCSQAVNNNIQTNEKPTASTDSYCFLESVLVVKPLSDAKQYSRPIKWFITSVVSICAAAAPLGSTILMPALGQIAEDLHTSRTKANLSIAFYSLAIAFVPLWWSNLSETYGRRPVYLFSFLLFILFNILSAESTSIDMFIVMRTLAGGASASVQAVGAGTVADLWPVHERGRAMGIFFLGPMCGPLISPIIGGAVSQPWGWRSTQWVMVIYGGVLWLLMIFFLPETSGKQRVTAVGSTNEPTSIRTRIRNRCLGICKAFVAPLQVLPLLRFMPILLVVFYASVTFASYYFLNLSIQATFSAPPYSFSVIEVGLLYIPSSLGYLLAGIFGGRWTDRIMHRRAAAAGRYDADGRLQFRPQDRVGEQAWLGGLVFPLALLWYGWTARYHVFWLVPCIANFFFGFGQMLIFNLTTVMLTEFVPRRTTTGVALNNLLRNSLACIAAVVAQPLLEAIGNGWLFTIVCLICLFSVLILVLLQMNADKWHEKMSGTLAAM